MITVDDVPVPVTIFPDHTSQVWKLPPKITGMCVSVRWVFENEAEFLQLAQLKALLDKCNYIADLKLPYLPYGRQDKEISNDTTFALYPFAQLLNSLQFKSVQILDPHSNVALKLINNSYAAYPIQTVKTIIEECGIDVLCFPDHGALQKYKNQNIYNFNIAFIYGEKVRDQATGNITSYKLLGDPAGKTVLITDDICDGGATFKLLAKDLLAASAKEVLLFVTHGIFSKGLQGLFDAGISRIFTNDGEKVVTAVKVEL